MGLTVAFDHDASDEGVEALIAAISLMKGVAGVTALPVEADLWIGQLRARDELRGQLLRVLWPEEGT
jgi:hypothetical protein